jgi:hypothetical protein
MALADLAILSPEWEKPLQQVSVMFGQAHEDVALLLIFLGTLPDEFRSEKHTSLTVGVPCSTLNPFRLNGD